MPPKVSPCATVRGCWSRISFCGRSYGLVSDFLGLRLTTYTKLAWSSSGGRGRTQTRSHPPVPVLRVLEPQACAATAAPAFCRAPLTAPVPAHAISPPLPLTSLTPSGARPHASPPAPERPRPSPPAAFLPTRGPHHARSPPCPTREGEIRPRPAASEAWERQDFVLLCAGARGPVPGRQRARHVTATLAPSAWSHASADFPPFPSCLGTFEKQKARFSPRGEGRVDLETGLQEGERRCQGQPGLCQGQESQP